ncbi:SDR family NAD(P)-dependent oxidoreductase [Pseudactinotalea sp. Z1732]|uniref:SDR family NAD(P)-dependent oxidoreductase n=1 Tax=Micrococcales TaxID=85006 RepID=UPI003C7DCCD0
MPAPIPDRFTGSTVLVTGAGHGIGRATAQRFLAEGARVVLADVDADAAGEVAEQYPGDHALALACDVTNTESVNEAVTTGARWAGGLDVLANVAGGARPHPPIEEMDDDEWAHELDLNLTGVMRCIRAVVPHLREGGSIVSVSSINGLAAFGSEPYSSAKAGLTALTRNLAIDLAARGLRINVVAPGTVRTRVWDGQRGGADRNAPLIPLGRPGEPEDIAAAIAFLASADAAWITGITLPVDGGMLTGPRQITTTAAWRDYLDATGDGSALGS